MMPWGDNNDSKGPKNPWGGGRSRGPNDPDIDELIKKSREKFKGFFSGGPNKYPSFGLIFLGVIIFWLATGFFKVETDEQAAVLRFGEFHRLSDPGLRYAMPFPIENVIKLKVTTVNKIEIGYRSSHSRSKDSKGSKVTEESLVLTGDENIVDANFQVQWFIKDLKLFLFNLSGVEQTIKNAAESAIREVIGKNPISTVLADGKREVIQQEAQELLQAILNSYESGVEIKKVQMLDASPPSAVLDAFRDVQNARADRERLRNEADAYRNGIIPQSRGEAEKLMQESEAYKQEAIAKAKGEAERFKSVYEQYRQAKDSTRQRLYLETMEEILKGMDKMLIENKSGAIPYLALPEIGKQKKEKNEQ